MDGGPHGGACLNAGMPPIDEVDLSQLPGWEELPAELRKTFAGARLPSSFLRRTEDHADFLLGPELRQIDVRPAGRFVRFGRRTGGVIGDFCLDPTTGEVVLALANNGPWFVNSSLDLLTRTIRLASGFVGQFTTGDAEECFSAAENFSDAVEQIDPPAIDLDNYWGYFIDEVKSGYYSDHENFSGN